jgi:hypothetical protein
MRVKSIILTVGFLSMMGAPVAMSSSVSSSDSVIAERQEVDVNDRVGSQGPRPSATSGSISGDVIDRGPTGKSELDSMKTVGEKVTRVDVIDSLPMGWQWDSMKVAGEKVMRVDVIDRVEWRGDVYAYTSGLTRVDVIDNLRS